MPRKREKKRMLGVNRVHIVVGVDNDIRIRESVASFVEPITRISSAEEFLRSGKVTEVSFLITDVFVPEMDGGIELHRWVRMEQRKEKPT
jgi:FixJ family two-component response regulator